MTNQSVPTREELNELFEKTYSDLVKIIESFNKISSPSIDPETVQKFETKLKAFDDDAFAVGSRLRRFLYHNSSYMSDKKQS